MADESATRRTRRIRVGCEFVHRAEIDTPVVMQIRPRTDSVVDLVEGGWEIDPGTSTRGYQDMYGNPCLRLTLPQGRSVFRYRAVAEVLDEPEPADPAAEQLPPEALPDDVLVYTLPSRFCLPEVLGGEALERFGGLPPDHSRVQAIVDYVWGHIRFEYGSSDALTTAQDVNLSGFGVCRDFAHLAITFCRALNIPARYVFGYLPNLELASKPDPMDFAAWMQVWLGDQWWTFDPRNNERRKGRVLIGHGRDASDVAMITSFGQPVLESMEVVAEPVPPATD